MHKESSLRQEQEPVEYMREVWRPQAGDRVPARRGGEAVRPAPRVAALCDVVEGTTEEVRVDLENDGISV